MLTANRSERIQRAYTALEGLSVGDAFGERWFFIAPEIAPQLMEMRALAAPIWDYTDDTQMALSIVSILKRYGEIRQGALAQSFAKHYNPHRKYGASMRGLFQQFDEGIHWQEASASLFEGQGSFGNGAAMRVAPLGAYFADDLDAVVKQAHLSAEVTHANAEGIAGAIAVAVATAFACRFDDQKVRPEPNAFIEAIIPFVQDSEVLSRIKRGSGIGSSTPIAGVVALLGNGRNISAQDTVPFCIWCASQHLDNYEESLWHTVTAGGDIDTNCAIVGGIVASYVGIAGMPEVWQQRREPLPSWV